jgi:hypothetical protein
MISKVGRAFVLFFLVLSGAAHADCASPVDLTEALSCLPPWVSFREVVAPEDPKIPAGYRRFDLEIEQPTDHFNPAAGTFRQKLVLLHKDLREPMVLQTGGYKIFAVGLSELAKSFGTNQIQVEHRFFDQSAPASLDWSKLNILQSAYDFHRITETFKPMYRSPWVNTGASKGGMTSTYHHRYFPNDMAGTVADVAPLSFSAEDPRYVGFVDNVGGEAYRACREKLTALQFAMLRRRQELMALVKGSFVYLGGKSVSFEHAVIELPFAFWQYQKPDDPKVGCDKIPSGQEPAPELAAYLEAVNSVESYGDTQVFTFMPYYFQAATQLGGPAAGLAHLNGLRLHPYSLAQYTPHVPYTYSNRTMREIESWAYTRAERMLFVYGELDPWSAAAFPRKSAGQDYHWFLVPGGNHGSKLFRLPEPEKSQAIAVVARWLGKRGLHTAVPEEEITLDDLELAARKQGGVP